MNSLISFSYHRARSHSTAFLFPTTTSLGLTQSHANKLVTHDNRLTTNATNTSIHHHMTMSTSDAKRMTIFYTPTFKQHRPASGRKHPECPERLDACIEALNEDKDLANMIDWTTPVEVQGQRREQVLEAVSAIHRFPDYLDELKNVSKHGGLIDADTYVAPGSYEIALLAASSWMEAVDVALTGTHGAAWALARPPGHHATPASGMGFCLLSNAAIAAKYALTKPNIKNVAILDFDVHHGNGTEASVKNEKGIRFASSHQYPLYPGTGIEGTSGAHKNILNINLPAGTNLKHYRKRYEEEMLPFLLQSEDGMPDLVIVSAGFDALDVDPLAQLDFKPSDYRLFTELLMDAVGTNTKLVFGLEGGYNLTKLGVGAAVRETISGFCFKGTTFVNTKKELANFENASSQD